MNTDPVPAPRSLKALALDIPWGMDGYQYRWLDELIVNLRAIEARLDRLEQPSPPQQT